MRDGHHQQFRIRRLGGTLASASGTDLRFLRSNDQIATMYGLPVEERVGRSLREVMPDVTAVTALCDALIATADGVHGRALEHTRLDDKRAAEVREPSVSSAS